MKIDTSKAEAPSFAPLPDGEYKCQINNAEVRENSKGTGKYVNVELEVFMPNGSTRRVWDVLNYENTSEMAQKIGLSRLRSLGEAIGMDADSIDPDGMTGKRVVAKLKIDNRDTDKNQVTLYKPAEATPVQSQPAVNDAGVSVNDGSTSRPWNNA